MAIFSTFFLDTLCQENVFYDILERKNAVLGYKKKKFKKSKIDIFPNGLTHCFGPKMAIFPTFFFFKAGKEKELTHGFGQKRAISPFFFLGNIGQEKFFFDILQQINAFLGYKNKKFKKLKNWHFSKVVNPWFWFKNGHFFNFSF